VVYPARKSSSVVANFTSAVLDLPTGAVAVLMNLHFPILGLTSPWEGEWSGGVLRFVDCGQLAGVFEEMGGYEMVSRDELERPVRPAELCHLSSAEMEQVKYWKPTRVGDIVFNYWD
jgi:hypothetical protein